MNRVLRVAIVLPWLLMPAQPGVRAGGLSIDRHVIASGGGTSSGGSFAVSGTLGQLEADPLHPATGGSYALIGGFWSPAATSPLPDALFANGFE